MIAIPDFMAKPGGNAPSLLARRKTWAFYGTPVLNFSHLSGGCKRLRGLCAACLHRRALAGAGKQRRAPEPRPARRAESGPAAGGSPRSRRGGPAPPKGGSRYAPDAVPGGGKGEPPAHRDFGIVYSATRVRYYCPKFFHDANDVFILVNGAGAAAVRNVRGAFTSAEPFFMKCRLPGRRGFLGREAPAPPDPMPRPGSCLCRCASSFMFCRSTT